MPGAGPGWVFKEDAGAAGAHAPGRYADGPGLSGGDHMQKGGNFPAFLPFSACTEPYGSVPLNRESAPGFTRLLPGQKTSPELVPRYSAVALYYSNYLPKDLSQTLQTICNMLLI